MKILRAVGTPVWVGIRVECQCGQQIELEPGDRVVVKYHCAYFDCPCGTHFFVNLDFAVEDRQKREGMFLAP